MDHTLEVFYVSVELFGKNGARQDVAKFFAREHAEAHLSALTSQLHPMIDCRVEKMIDQHVAHRPG